MRVVYDHYGFAENAVDGRDVAKGSFVPCPCGGVASWDEWPDGSDRRMYRKEYENYSHFLNECQTLASAYQSEWDGRGTQKPRRSRQVYTDSWRTGGWSNSLTFEEAVEHCIKGDANTDATLFRVSKEVTPPPSSMETYRYRYSTVAGSRVNLTNYISGSPDCMYRYRIQTREGTSNMVKLGINTRCAASVESVQFANRGGAVIAICEALEQAGFNVSITALKYGEVRDHTRHGSAGDRTYAGKWVVNYVIPLKAFGEPMDISRMGFAIANSDQNRRMNWSAQESTFFIPQAREARDCGYTWDASREVELAKVEGFDLFFPENGRVEGCGFYTVEETRAWVERTVNSFMGVMPEEGENPRYL